MTRTLLISFIFSISCSFSYAQNFKIEGKWQMQNLEFENNQDEANEITKENCFLAFYADPANHLEFLSNTVLINIGEETQLYEWRIENNTLVLSANNTVMIKGKDGQITTQQNIGETTFDIQRKGKVLMLTRVNSTFTETYTFSLAK